MKPAEQSFLEAMLETPNDLTLRLVFADWLEERGDPRGELLRLTHCLTQSIDIPNRSELEVRVQTLLKEGVQAIGPFWTNSLGMKFAWIPAGTFLMGSPEDEEGRVTENEIRRRSGLGEGPRHEVTLTHGFWMGTSPVTQVQYARVVGRNPSWAATESADVEAENRDRPVQEVTWYDAVAFLKRLSKRDGETGPGPQYRLPTEAEWEYACRAGTTTRFWSGNSEADLARVGWYVKNSGWEMGSGMHPVGKSCNPFGLSDMHGNVWEWCLDLYDENYYARSPKQNPRCKRGESEQRVMRGGDAWDEAGSCRSAARNSNDADCSHNDISFRIVTNRRRVPHGEQARRLNVISA